MKPALALIAPLFVAGCVSVSDDTPGQIVSYNGYSVIVQGGVPSDFGPAVPNSAMTAQARAVCPGATFAGAETASTEFVLLYDYTFIC